MTDHGNKTSIHSVKEKARSAEAKRAFGSKKILLYFCINSLPSPTRVPFSPLVTRYRYTPAGALFKLTLALALCILVWLYTFSPNTLSTSIVQLPSAVALTMNWPLVGFGYTTTWPAFEVIFATPA